MLHRPLSIQGGHHSAPYHPGESVHDDIEEYRKRSPVNHARELDTPLLIHTTTNDEDVNFLEVAHLIQALTFEKKNSKTRSTTTPPAATTSIALTLRSPSNPAATSTSSSPDTSTLTNL